MINEEKRRNFCSSSPTLQFNDALSINADKRRVDPNHVIVQSLLKQLKEKMSGSSWSALRSLLTTGSYEPTIQCIGFLVTLSQYIDNVDFEWIPTTGPYGCCPGTEPEIILNHRHSRSIVSLEVRTHDARSSGPDENFKTWLEQLVNDASLVLIPESLFDRWMVPVIITNVSRIVRVSSLLQEKSRNISQKLQPAISVVHLKQKNGQKYVMTGKLAALANEML